MLKQSYGEKTIRFYFNDFSIHMLLEMSPVLLNAQLTPFTQIANSITYHGPILGVIFIHLVYTHLIGK